MTGYVIYRCYRCNKELRSDTQSERVLLTAEASDESHMKTERFTLCAEDAKEFYAWLNGPRNADCQNDLDIPLGDNGQ